MRIIAGKYKGKILSEFKLSTTRPTSDLVREALFDKIGFQVLDCVFLDLFSGTGAVGVEALSRGAKQVYFVDNNNEAMNLIKKNIASVSASNFDVLKMNFGDALDRLYKQNIKFDIIFLDPPYATNFAEEAITIIKNYDLICENGLIIWEHDETKNKYISQNFENSKTKKYGKKYLTYINL